MVDAKYHREWRKKNPGKAAATQARYKSKDPNAYRIAQGQWRRRQPEMWAFTKQASSARARGATEFMSREEFAMLWRERHCHWCDCELHESFRWFDHIIPLCYGGQHTFANVVASCANCNIRREWERKRSKDY